MCSWHADAIVCACAADRTYALGRACAACLILIKMAAFD